MAYLCNTIILSNTFKFDTMTTNQPSQHLEIVVNAYELAALGAKSLMPFLNLTFGKKYGCYCGVDEYMTVEPNGQITASKCISAIMYGRECRYKVDNYADLLAFGLVTDFFGVMPDKNQTATAKFTLLP